MEGVVNGPIPDDFMRNTGNRLNPFRFDEKKNEFSVLDQLLLPHKIEYVPVRNSEDAFKVIRSMQVRGAPLIAVVGALGLLVDISGQEFGSSSEFVEFVKSKVQYLLGSRPTAINLRNAMDLILKTVDVEGDAVDKKKRVVAVILKLLHDETEENRKLVWNGYQEITKLKSSGSKFTLMTICNTGALATSSWGTALGIIFALHQAGLIDMVYALETRPYNQGIRLTATELHHFNVPFKIITDSMAAWTMKTHKIDAILTGADQVALNGDTANKIGTYMLAVLAKHHGVPFYPVVPTTTINRSRESGDSIPIEERPAMELLSVNGTLVSAQDTPVWNPAFDVTPAELITKIITDRGNFTPAELKQNLV
ncbi:S-methyl-5-thioribose-1-phosphate isomerase [Oesophagostomum dentatum]|uniref:Methylthioribose-1-phosphate isomerase n=1 Tax=Oesophagostomum dentatum TaxID=61180 RepID=A0A0B1TIS2_OESDE|nr:S-methyl-5-thioribose-1-phosphate isomerase [Oesophagostomum dentatum]